MKLKSYYLSILKSLKAKINILNGAEDQLRIFMALEIITAVSFLHWQSAYKWFRLETFEFLLIVKVSLMRPQDVDL